MGKCHRATLRDQKGALLIEARYSNTTGILYRQNRSYDLVMSFEDFLNRLNNSKKQAKDYGHSLECDVINENKLWEV